MEKLNDNFDIPEEKERKNSSLIFPQEWHIILNNNHGSFLYQDMTHLLGSFLDHSSFCSCVNI
jgi:hypothetical protein